MEISGNLNFFTVRNGILSHSYGCHSTIHNRINFRVLVTCIWIYIPAMALQMLAFKFSIVSDLSAEHFSETGRHKKSYNIVKSLLHGGQFTLIKHQLNVCLNKSNVAWNTWQVAPILLKANIAHIYTMKGGCKNKTVILVR